MRLCDEFFKQEMSTRCLENLKALKTDAEFTDFVKTLQNKYKQHVEELYKLYPN